MDNKVNIKIANSNQQGFVSANINDIVCYAKNSNNAFHIGIQNTSNYLTFKDGITNIHNKVQIVKDLQVIGDLTDANGHSYTVGALADGAITSNFIADSNINAYHLANNIIQENNIVPLSITEQSISNNSITYEKLTSNTLKAENINAGVFNQGTFTFTSNTNFNEGIICHPTSDKIIKVSQKGNPYIIDAYNDDYDGRAINIVNSTTINGNSENLQYAMVNIYMPQLAQNKNNKVRIGKNNTRALEFSYTANNTNTTSNIDTAEIKLLSSTGNSPNITLTSNAIGINNRNPGATLDCEGNFIFKGNTRLVGSMEFTGEIMKFKDETQFTFSNNDLILTTANDTIVNLSTSNSSFTVQDSNQTNLFEVNSNITVNTDIFFNNSVNVKNSDINMHNNTLLINCMNGKSGVSATSIGFLSPGIDKGIFVSTLTQSHATSFNHFVANNGIEPVFQVKRDGLVLSKGLKSTGNVGINTEPDQTHALKVSGNVHISNKYFGDGSEIQNINANNINSGALNHLYVGDLPANKITSATMLADRISGGTMGVIDGNNIQNVNATNITGVYSSNATYDTNVVYKSVNNKPHFEFKTDGKLAIHSSATQFTNDIEMNQAALYASNVYGDFFHGNGFSLTHINAGNLVGSFGNDFRFATDSWIKSSDEQDRFKFTSNATYVAGPSNLYLQTSNVEVNSECNITITNPSPLANVTSCYTGINYASNQNLSDLEYELKGTVSLRHYPSNSNNPNDNVRALTVSRHDKVTAFISSSGIVYGESTYYTSDERVKTDIIDIKDSDATSIMSRLNPKKYKKWTSFDHDVEQGDIGKTESGFIAQDVYDQVPELRHLIDLPIDSDMDKNDWGTKKAHLNYTGLIAYLVAAIKDQQRQINEIKHVVFN